MKKAVIWIALTGAVITVIILFFSSHASTSSTAGNEGVRTTQTQSGQGRKVENDGPLAKYTLVPGGRGRLIPCNFKRVHCIVSGPCQVREVNGSPVGKWKEDGPGRDTTFNFSIAKHAEYRVPPGYPGEVTITVVRN